MICDRPLTLLAAWGGLVTSRPYLPSLLRDILQLTTRAGCDWVSLGDLTKGGHPRHPLYVRADTPLRAFSVDRYLGDLLLRRRKLDLAQGFRPGDRSGG